MPGVAHDVGVSVGAIGEGERPTIGVGGNLAVGEAGGEEEGPRATHSQLDDVRHDPVERHLKYFDSNHVVKFPAAVAVIFLLLDAESVLLRVQDKFGL